jgi:hypothetical protein
LLRGDALQGAQLGKRNHFPALFIPEREADAANALRQRYPSHILELRVVVQDVGQPIVGYAAAHVLHEKVVGRPQAEHHQRVTAKAIGKAPQSRGREIFADRERGDIADALVRPSRKYRPCPGFPAAPTLQAHSVCSRA